jgi:anti-sigma B factor antagonist
VNTIVERDVGGVSVVALLGEHDVTTAPALGERLAALQAAGRPVAIDLAAATFVDSSIIGTLLNARRRAEAGGTGFAVALGGADGIVRRAVEIMNLQEDLGVCDGRLAAIAAAGAAPV